MNPQVRPGSSPDSQSSLAGQTTRVVAGIAARQHGLWAGAIVLILAVTGLGDETTRPVDYVRDIRPVLHSRCVSCHGPLKQKGGLRLDTAHFAIAGGDSGPAVEAGHPDQSLLIERVTALEPAQRMPPEGKGLSAEQVEALRRWISDGLTAPPEEQPLPDPRRHWSFQSPVATPLPEQVPAEWRQNPIDALIASRHQAQGLTPHGLADRATLLRRVTLDLTGLPPTRDQLHDFLSDTSPGAYERVVERLLASPQYGERWGRHWMDVWRYSDWYGRRDVNDVRNSYAQIWRWRDWIVQSLNDDKRYDRMIVEMLAADEVDPANDRAQVATGYLVRNWYSLNYNQWMRDLVEHTGKAFLGLTLNCAHCHDHKYDPISQREYFQFRAFFEPLEIRRDRVPGEPDPGPFQDYTVAASTAPIPGGMVRVYDKTLEAVTRLYHGGDERNLMTDQPPALPAAPAILGGDRVQIAPVEIPPAGHYPGLKSFIREETVAAVRQRLSAARSARTQTGAALAEAIQAWQAHCAAQPGPCSLAEVIAADQWIGHWTFEGSTESEGGFWADSSVHRRTLERVTGTDPAVVAHSPASPLDRGGTAFSLAPPGGPAQRQQAEFQQLTNYAYLATAPRQAPPIQNVTITLRTHIAQSAPGFNRTFVEHEGTWIWLHRGIDATTSELRVLLYDETGTARDVATASGESPLLLKTGRDYQLALLLDSEQISLFAVDLEIAGPVEVRRFPRGDGVNSYTNLRAPQGEQRIKIGNSDGTGRHVGLIDEVCYASSAVPSEQLTQVLTRLAADVAPARAWRQALHADQTQELHEQAALRDLESIQSRIAADDVRYLGVPGDASELTRRAAQSERHAATAAARAAWFQSLGDLDSQRLKSPPDPAAVTKAAMSVTLARTALSQAESTETQEAVSYTALSPQYPAKSTGRRRALAEWITRRDNPLTARVAVNHIWLRHFGKPLVESVTDFGNNGKLPSHPELLDWMAVFLMHHDWQMKPLHRLIVTSRTYRIDSHPEPPEGVNATRDRDNRFFWRFPARRLEAEAVRDSILFAAGSLDLARGGPEIRNQEGQTVLRRGLYFSQHAEGGGRMEFESLFDAPDVCDCYRRTQSIMPQQSLALTNSELVRRESRRLAFILTAEIDAESTSDESRSQDFVERAFEQILSRSPTAAELAACLEFLHSQTAFLARALAAGPVAPPTVTPPHSPVMRARESLIRALFNHHDFVMLK